MARKAQMEIMGLVIVVILIALGILFALRFSLSAEKTDLRQEVVESELGSHMLNAMLSTTTNCTHNPITLAELYQDCSVANTIVCNSQRKACEEARFASEFIFNKTLDAWGKDYYFTIEGAASFQAQSLLNISNNGPCQRLYELKTVPLPTRVGTALLKLYICK